MERIIIPIDARNIDRNTLDFACFIARLTHSKLTGIFLENVLLEEVDMVKDIVQMAAGVVREKGFNRITEKEKTVSDNIQLFKSICENNGIRTEIIYDHKLPVDMVVAESRFADLVILNAETSFEKNYEGTPTRFVKDVLAAAECPVLIAPFSFSGIDEILFTYDGSSSSAFAIKQFTYLFPEFDEEKITVLQVNSKEEMPVAEREKIGDLVKMHFSSIGFRVLQGQADEELFKYLNGKKNIMVVMGAFGRGVISNLFRQSTAELIVKAINLPVFIAHR
jgi:hypothetical protein